MLQDFYQTQKFIELNLNSLEQGINPPQWRVFLLHQWIQSKSF